MTGPAGAQVVMDLPAPLDPAYASREALRLMPGMLKGLRNVVVCLCGPPCRSCEARLDAKHTVLRLIERAEHRA